MRELIFTIIRIFRGCRIGVVIRIIRRRGIRTGVHWNKKCQCCGQFPYCELSHKTLPLGKINLQSNISFLWRNIYKNEFQPKKIEQKRKKGPQGVLFRIGVARLFSPLFGFAEWLEPYGLHARVQRKIHHSFSLRSNIGEFCRTDFVSSLLASLIYAKRPHKGVVLHIGVARFELTTFCSQSRRSTRLSYTPKCSKYNKKSPIFEYHDYFFSTKSFFYKKLYFCAVKILTFAQLCIIFYT